MKKGKKVRVVNNDHKPKHWFKIGETVECVGLDNATRSDYKGCFIFKREDGVEQTLNSKCYEPIKKPKTREQLEKKIAKLTKQLEGLDKPKFEVGEWVWVDRNYDCPEEEKALVVYPKHGNMTYGFSHKGNWTETYGSSDTFKNKKHTITKATEEEVFEALKAEAIKRGYKEGVRFKSAVSEETFIIDSLEPWYSPFGSLFMSSIGIVFSDGKWAKIISTPTLNGKEVKITENTITIGCEEFNKQLFESKIKYLDMLGITSLTHPELGEIKINDLKELIK